MEDRKVPYGGILICLIIRVIVGAFFGIMTGISSLGPLSGNMGILTMIAGFMCIPTAILFFMRKPVFPIAFFITVILNMIGGFVIANNPLMRIAAMFLPIQSIMPVLVIIMDVLFLIYLIRSVRVRDIFGANLFRGGGGSINQPRPVYNQPPRTVNAPKAPPIREEHYQEEYNNQNYEPEPSRYYAPPQPSREYMPHTYQKPPQHKHTGLVVGLIVVGGIATTAFIMILMVFIMAGSLLGFGGSILGGGGGESLFGGNSLFGDSTSIEESGKTSMGIKEYINSEITSEISDLLTDKLNDSGFTYGFVDLKVFAEGNNLVLTVVADIPPTIYENDDKLNTFANELKSNSEVSSARKNVVDILSGDIKEKTDINSKVIIEYYAPDGSRIVSVG